MPVPMQRHNCGVQYGAKHEPHSQGTEQSPIANVLHLRDRQVLMCEADWAQQQAQRPALPWSDVSAGLEDAAAQPRTWMYRMLMVRCAQCSSWLMELKNLHTVHR